MPNWIDFDVQLCPDPQSLEWKRGHMGVTREGIRLMIRPYSFDEKQAGTPRDYRLLKARAKALNDMNISERGIQLLERACSMGAVDFDALVQTFEKSGCQLTGQLGDPWIRIGRMRCNAWYDILMISPFFPKRTDFSLWGLYVNVKLSFGNDGTYRPEFHYSQNCLHCNIF